MSNVKIYHHNKCLKIKEQKQTLPICSMNNNTTTLIQNGKPAVHFIACFCFFPKLRHAFIACLHMLGNMLRSELDEEKKGNFHQL